MAGSNRSQSPAVRDQANDVPSGLVRTGLEVLFYGVFFWVGFRTSWAIHFIIAAVAIDRAIPAGSAAAGWAKQTTSSAAGKIKFWKKTTPISEGKIKFWGKGSENE